MAVEAITLTGRSWPQFSSQSAKWPSVLVSQALGWLAMLRRPQAPMHGAEKSHPAIEVDASLYQMRSAAPGALPLPLNSGASSGKCDPGQFGQRGE